MLYPVNALPLFQKVTSIRLDLQNDDGKLAEELAPRRIANLVRTTIMTNHITWVELLHTYTHTQRIGQAVDIR